MWFSVVVIHKDVFESSIIDEKHYGENEKAAMNEFVDTYKNDPDNVAVILDM